MAADDGDLLRAFLAARSVPCPGCSYDLRGLTGSACPECGRQISLSVVGTPQPLGAFLLLLLPFGLLPGLALFVLMITAGAWRVSSNDAMGLVFGSILINTLAGLVIYRRRERFFGLARALRGRLAAGNWLLQAIIMALVVYLWY